MALFDSGWSTTSETGIISLEAKEPEYSYDRMKQLETYTDYEFSTTQKAAAIANEIKEEAKATAQTIDTVFSNVGNAIKNGSTVLKFVPLFAVVAGYFYLKKAYHGK